MTCRTEFGWRFEVNGPKQKKAERFIEQQIGGYIVEKELGRGGFGAVYLARTAQNGRPLALKVMLSRIAIDAVAVKKFLRESRSVSDLRHPRMVESRCRENPHLAAAEVHEFGL